MRTFAAASLIALLTLYVPARAAAQAQPAPEQHFMPWQAVDHIVSGSVIDVRGLGLVRLAGIDEAGELSRAFLAGVIGSQPVRVVPTMHSSNGLTEGLVYTPDGRTVNAEMLRSGYARVRATPGFDRLGEFRGLQEDAQRLKRGMWSAPSVRPPVAAAAGAPQASPRTAPERRFYLGAAGGTTVGPAPRDWIAGVEAGAAVTRALGLYLTAGYMRNLGGAGFEGSPRAWHGSAGVRVTAPVPLPIRPFLRAGGGYMRIEPRSALPPRRNEPFWEAGAGIVAAGGPVQLEGGYTYARVDGRDAARAYGLFAIRF